MDVTKRSHGVKAALSKLQRGKWRAAGIWFSTSDVDDVEIIETFIAQQSTT
jgi:hypothetical protein